MTFYVGLNLLFILLSLYLASGSGLDSVETDTGDIQLLRHFPEDKRTWSNFRGTWGKRANWNKLQGMWGKRMAENAPSDDYTTLVLQDPSQVVGQNPNAVIYTLDALPVKRSWQRFAGSWGKREDPKVISPRSNNWSSLRGSWGKRGGNWNNFRGSWGKRSLDNLEDASKTN